MRPIEQGGPLALEGTPIYRYHDMALLLGNPAGQLEDALLGKAGATMEAELRGRLGALVEEMQAIVEALELDPVANDADVRRLDIGSV